MHIKTGTWEASSTVCESDSLCDPAVLVSAPNTEPHIRNRRLSPGAGNCGGGGGGGCISASEPPQPRQPSPEGDLIAPDRHAHAFNLRRDKERKGAPHKGRSLRREGQKAAGAGTGGRSQRANQKERWVEDSLSLLRPPPAFPVQDSPAKLQPAVSYASKVKAGPVGGALEEERPAIGVLLQNQWGLSFISEGSARPDSAPDASDAGDALPAPPTDADQPAEPTPLFTAPPPEATPTPPATSTSTAPRSEPDESRKLLLSCRHLVEALSYHSREWNATCNKQKKVPKKVVWYKDSQEHPA